MKGITTTLCVLLVALFVGLSPAAATGACDENLPAPVAELVGFSHSADADGNPLVTFVLSVENWSSYPVELFENVTDLPAFIKNETKKPDNVGPGMVEAPAPSSDISAALDNVFNLPGMT